MTPLASHIRHCFALSLILATQVHSHAAIHWPEAVKIRSPSCELSLQTRRQRQQRQRRRRQYRSLATKDPLSYKTAILTRGGSTALNSTANTKISQLFDVVKSYWYLGILEFGGTPTLVALLRERNSISTQQRQQNKDSFWELVAALHALPGSTSSQLVVATAASQAGILGGIIALLLHTAPGFMLLTCAGVICRQGSARTCIGHLFFELPLKLLMQSGVTPVALACTLQKSIVPVMTQLDGLQRIIALCSCGWASMSLSKGTSRMQNFAVPTILAMGGLVTFLEDFKSEVPIPNVAPPTTSDNPKVQGQEVSGLLVSSRVDNPPLSVVEVEAVRVQKGFGGIPVLNSETPEPFDFVHDLEQVADELEEVQAKFDQYLDEYFVDDLQDVEEYTEYFAANSPPTTELSDFFDQGSLTFGTPNLASSFLQESDLGASSVSGTQDLRFSDPNSSNEVATSHPGNRTNTLFQQQPRGGSIALRIRPNDAPPIPSAYAVIAWLLVMFVTTFIKLDIDLYKIFAMNFRTGSFVFGGGPILLPQLAAKLIPTNLVSEQEFFHGTLIAQSLPGSVFNMAAYLGAIQHGWLGAAVAQIGMTMPGFLMVMALLPHWSRLRREQAWFQSTSRGVTAAAVGLLCSACLSTYGRCIQKGTDVMLFVGTGCLLTSANITAPVVIVLGAIIGAVFSVMNLDPMVYQ
ncbi:Chromate transporter [Fragilaria crotonensis]|nr:Chromate transporter [Fragilaria crotonensis]